MAPQIIPTIDLAAPLVQFIVDRVIQATTNGDTAKQLARAQDVIAINAALLAIDNGDPNGTVALAAALNTTALTPGEGLALQTLFAIVGKQVALLTSVAGATLLGVAGSAVATMILNAGTATAQAYVAKYGTPAAPAA